MITQKCLDFSEPHLAPKKHFEDIAFYLTGAFVELDSCKYFNWIKNHTIWNNKGSVNEEFILLLINTFSSFSPNQVCASDLKGEFR